MESKWIFLQNVFINATRTSYRKMKQIGDYTLAALNAYTPPKTPTPPFNFADIATLLTPLVADYDDAYAVWLSQQGMQKGQTQSLTNLLKQLGAQQIEDWDLAIQNVYRQKTPQYMALLPRHRQPFQNGSQQDRITAVGALSLAIGDDAKLQTLKTDVDAAHDALVAALNSQKGSKSIKGGSSSDVKAKRIALATGLYGALGALMYYFMQTPDVIGNFFLLEALRNKEQVSFSHDIKGGETALVFTRTLEDGDKLSLENRGNTILQVALVHEKNDAMPAGAFTLQANEEETVSPDALGAKGNRYLIVKNMSATEKGAFIVEIV